MSEFGAEFYRREGEDALEWAMQQDGEWKGSYRGVLAPVLNEAAATSPTILKRWLDRLSEDVDFRASAHQFSQLAMDRAAERGTDDWIAAAKALDNYWVAGSMASAPFYSDDFDFSRMLKEVPEGPGVGDAVGYWAAQDKDAAWSSLKEFYDSKNPDGTFYLGALWQGVATTTESQAAIGWTVSRLDLIPDEMRDMSVYSLIVAGADRSEEFEPLLKSLPRESDRITAAQHMLETQTNAKQLKLAMNSLPRQEQMAAVLSMAESYRKSFQSGDEYQAAGIAKRLEKPMKILELSDEEKAQVMSRVGDP
ncbi:hypothetical protein JIN85_11765 [Luteolibacter pohnpeiensis]|uniref:Uncharacterized protein n=1 Tax=Luteolibacter pohnpeiensis TaxID=454153 RepID=A0A934S6G2_9BACT|nr:hypothetical protein [Luteolibacter pohnpeiensis]MBK1883097.1 hypothetical protein [Luteolibacter pohnpeiensis]